MASPTILGVRAIVIDDDRLVVVEHNEAGRGRFYLLPGGGLEAGESIFQAARREVLEETELEVEPLQLCYVREVKVGATYGIEFYVLCAVRGGVLALGSDPEKSKQVLVRVERIPLDSLAANASWYPEELRALLGDDARAGFPTCRYLGVAELS